jgi:hypothetical protein
LWGGFAAVVFLWGGVLWQGFGLSAEGKAFGEFVRLGCGQNKRRRALGWAGEGFSAEGGSGRAF